MNWYLLAYFRRYRLRSALTVLGLSMALCSVFIAYAIAAWVDSASSRALTFVIRDGALWVVPKEGVRLDRKLQAIMSPGHLDVEAIRVALATEPTAIVRRMAVGRATLNGVPVVLYA